MSVSASQSMGLATLDLNTGGLNAKIMREASTSAPASQDDVKLMKSCRQLEGVFFNMMLKEMRKTVQESGLIGDSAHEREIFTEMMDNDIAQKMSDTDKLDNGIANMLFKQLSGGRTFAASGVQSAQAEEERKERLNHGTRSFAIQPAGHYRAAQIRAAYPTAAPRSIEPAAQSASGRK